MPPPLSQISAVIVVDASVVVNALADDGVDGGVARRRLIRAGELVAPDLVDVETVSVLRRRWFHGDLTSERFAVAVEDLGAFAVERLPTLPLMDRAFELRANVTVCDAAYVALYTGPDGQHADARYRSPLVTRRHRWPARRSRRLSGRLAGRLAGGSPVPAIIAR